MPRPNLYPETVDRIRGVLEDFSTQFRPEDEFHPLTGSLAEQRLAKLVFFEKFSMQLITAGGIHDLEATRELHKEISHVLRALELLRMAGAPVDRRI